MRPIKQVNDFVIVGDGNADPARAEARRQWAQRTAEFLDRTGHGAVLRPR